MKEQHLRGHRVFLVETGLSSDHSARAPLSGLQRLIEIKEKQLKEEMRPISEMDGDLAARRLQHRLETAPKEIKKRLLRALIGEIIVYGDEIVIRGPNSALAETLLASQRTLNLGPSDYEPEVF